MWAVLVIAAVLIGLGAVLVVASRHTVYDSAPLPSASFSGSAAPTGPDLARVHLDAKGDNDNGTISSRTGTRHDPTGEQEWVRATTLGPNRLFIPSLGVYARVETITISGGDLEIPGNPRRVGRWSGGQAMTGGDQGTTLLTGHVETADGRVGALYHLADISAGARIWTSNAQGDRQEWAVTVLRTEARHSSHADLFASGGSRRLVVTTCGGPLVGGHYTRTVVVEARPVGGVVPHVRPNPTASASSTSTVPASIMTAANPVQTNTVRH
jgi:hypothetical protein